MAAPIPPTTVPPAITRPEPEAEPIDIINAGDTTLEPILPLERPEISRQDTDTRSDADTSSLSELIEGSEDHDGRTHTSGAASLAEENDSEAETERLEQTPRKDWSSTSALGLHIGNFGASPTKLNTNVVMEAPSPPESPITPVEETDVPTLHDKHEDDNALAIQQSLATVSNASSLLNDLSRKRKRSTPEADVEGDDSADAPARKRSTSSRPSLSDIQSPELEATTLPPLDQELAPEGNTNGELDLAPEPRDELMDNVEAQAETHTRTTKRPKGKRKGKKIIETTEIEPIPSDTADVPDLEETAQNAEEDEEDSAAFEEELEKKRKALETLADIRDKFSIFREKELNEQIQNLNLELESLEGPEPSHSEFLEQMRVVDERRDEKLAQENLRHDYKVKTLNKTTIAERHQVQGQFFQAVREHKDRIIQTCHARLNQLSRERRRTGSDEVEYSLLYNPRRPEQIQKQAAYNKEVSILAGFAKYRGFPGAPDISSARSTEVEEDFRAMSIPSRVSVQAVAKVYGPTVPESAQSAQQNTDDFLRRNPWANPQNAVPQMSSVSSQPRNNPLVTPASQKRTIDIHAPNGSASTIEASSNPPSSAAPGSNTDEQTRHRKPDTTSPLFHFKRAANGGDLSRQPNATSLSSSNNPSPAMAQGWRGGQKDSASTENPYSSPMAHKGRDNQRPFGLASAAASAFSMPGPSRNKTPISQRNAGLSVGGSGNSMFGR